MSDEKRRILEMVADGTITQEDAVRLLDALGDENVEEAPREEPAGQNANTPHLTLFPDGESLDKFSEAISETVKKAIGQAADSMESWPEKMDDLGEHIASAVSETVENAIDQAAGSMESWPEKMDGLSEQIDRVVDQAVQTGHGAVDSIGGFVNQVLSECLPAEEPAGTFIQPYAGEPITDKVTALTVHWVAGPVEVVQGEGEHIRITEFAKRPLEPEERMGLSVDNGEVEIHWIARRGLNLFGRLKSGILSKRLLIELPAGLDRLYTLKVHTGSGSVTLTDLQPLVEDFTVEAASGSVTLRGIHAEDLTVHTASGSLFAQSVSGSDLSFESVSGDLRLIDITGEELSAHTSSGSLSADHVSADDLELHTVSGSLTADFLSGNELDLDTVSGAMNVTNCEAHEVDANTVSGGLHLSMTDLPHELELNSASGGVVLTLPDEPELGFTVQYSTHSGTFRSDFPLNGSPGGKKGEGSYGAGKTEISIDTVSGGIRLRKA